MKGRYTILLLLVFSLIQVAYAGNPHLLWGYCNDGHEGTSASGSEVFMYIEGKNNQTLTATVESNRVYYIDASEFTEWNIGDVVVLKIEKSGCYADKIITLNSAGSQRIPDLALTCPEPDSNSPDMPKNTLVKNISANSGEQESKTPVNITGDAGNATDSGIKDEVKINASAGEQKTDNKSAGLEDDAEKETHTNIPENDTSGQKEPPGKENEPGNYLLLLGLFIVAVIVILFFVLRKKKQPEVNKTEKTPEAKTIPKLTDKEIKVLNALISQSMSEEELSKKIGPAVSYTTEKLKSYNLIYFDDAGKAHIHEWAKPKFIYEYILDSEQQSIVMLLKKEDSLTQTKISGKTNISPSTLTRRLEKLEEMKVIERQTGGSQKNVKLTNWFRNNI
jgi:hypothetical protein